MKIKFKKDFWFGAASSGPQSEGSKNKVNKSIMETWYDQTPTDFFEGVGPDEVIDLYSRHTEAVELLDEIKLNSYRTSIQWSQLINNFETLEVNQDAVNFYRDYFKEVNAKGAKLVVNLFHFDMPTVLQEIGGWTNRKVVELFEKYAKVCFELFGDLVDYWSTFNEPVVPVELGYLYGVHYPKQTNFSEALLAGHHTILAHAKVVNVFREVFKNQSKKQIAIILNLTPTYPKNDEAEHVNAARIRDLLCNKTFLETAIFGRYPKELVTLLKNENLMPEFQKTDLEIIAKAKIDFLGVNFYQPCRVQAPKPENKDYPSPQRWFEEYILQKRRMNESRGWEIHPKTIYNIAMDIKNNYDNIPWYISENGMGAHNEEPFKNSDGIIQDDYRINFIKEHLYFLHKGIAAGSNCFGYHLWTLIDNWSWNNVFKNRYGFIEFNLKTKEFKVKSSGLWIKSVRENNNEFEIEESLIALSEGNQNE
ncbi:6-phospho-beta-glucosidase [Spiroplasma clarkii]|uniref:6-phospho-beta-glucosidase n=1 Tax=Spiroplasma clarkii TaxID=2139 RepID=A0A1Y0L157_9MOLU|nr:glycoside hydrolase family 1 protein [Spiroplasma clarkii]ARU91742.1 6-phospho-beta-glucosidase [Spiroplasma clarkii]ATX71121.1 6-phospho-beta-glucosidase [Spiroplasma clarkii]